MSVAPRNTRFVDLREKLSARIRLARQAAGLSQSQLASVLGVSGETIRSWDRGRRLPSLEILPVLADTLNVSLDWLLRD